MPIDTAVRPRMAATIPACRAVVAARREAPERMRPLLRRLRVRTFRGELLDEQETIHGAARDAGIDPDDLERWIADPATEEALREDMAAARAPLPAALVLDERLANWSGGRRYTCPSYEIERAGRRRPDRRARLPALPGLRRDHGQPAPRRPARRPAGSAEEVLRWTGTPLASKEVAVVRDIGLEDAREELGRVAEEEHVGSDGFWTLPGSHPYGG